MMGQEIRDSVIGFFGFGGIGQAIAKRLQNWQAAKFIYHTRKPRTGVEQELQAQHVTFEQLLSESDFIVVCAPLTEETKLKFNDDAFAKMKFNCVFINVARGGLVDQNALYNALKNNKIFSAGLDVMTPEPLPANDALLTLTNCGEYYEISMIFPLYNLVIAVIIPHLGTQTMKTTTEMGTVAAMNILNSLEGKPMLSPAY